MVTVRGQRGGLRLARPASEINVGAVVRRSEADLDMMPCFGAQGACVIKPDCVLAVAVDDALRAFLAVLDGYTLADLVRPRAALARLLRARRSGVTSPAGAGEVETRSVEGEGDRVASLYLRYLHRAGPIALTLLRFAPSTSPAPAGEVIPRVARDRQSVSPAAPFPAPAPATSHSARRTRQQSSTQRIQAKSTCNHSSIRHMRVSLDVRRGDRPAQHAVDPGRVGQHDRQEDHRRHGHHHQCRCD